MVHTLLLKSIKFGELTTWLIQKYIALKIIKMKGKVL
jgi:hypothetical protein